MIILCLCLQSEGPDQCSQPEDLVSWWCVLYDLFCNPGSYHKMKCISQHCFRQSMKFIMMSHFQNIHPVCVSLKDKMTICILFDLTLFNSDREWPRWLTAGGIPCWFCRRCSKTVQPALSSLPTTLTVWGWVRQALPATCLWLSWGQITAEPCSHKVSLRALEERNVSAAIVYCAAIWQIITLCTETCGTKREYYIRGSLVSLPCRDISFNHIVMCSTHDFIPQFQACVHTSSPFTSPMSVARLCACGRIWWSWMSFTSFQNFPVIPLCIWLCVTLYSPPGTRIARYAADVCQWLFANIACFSPGFGHGI